MQTTIKSTDTKTSSANKATSTKQNVINLLIDDHVLFCIRFNRDRMQHFFHFVWQFIHTRPLLLTLFSLNI